MRVKINLDKVVRNTGRRLTIGDWIGYTSYGLRPSVGRETATQGVDLRLCPRP